MLLVTPKRVKNWEAHWAARNHSAPAMADNTAATKAFEGGHLRLYEKFTKAEGSALCQARTEDIRLQGFLFRRKVPGLLFLPVHTGTATKPRPTSLLSVRIGGLGVCGRSGTLMLKLLRYGARYGPRPCVERLASVT